MKKTPFLRRTSREDASDSASDADASAPPANPRRKTKKWSGAKSGAKSLMSSITFGTIGHARNRSSMSDLNSSGESYNLEALEQLDGDSTEGSHSHHVRFSSSTKRPSFTPTLPGAISEIPDPQDGHNDGGRGRHSRKSTVRRANVNASELTMGLSDLSADFLDLMLKSKGIDWLKSLSLRDPRFCIKMFFDDVARDGADGIEDPNGKGFHPELLSPLLAMFQRSSVFSVWRPTSIDSIEKMMKGHGVGKGLDIKGKSAKKGKLSAYVPFLQIHEDEHKTKIRTLPSGGKIRVFYRKEAPRDKAYDFLIDVMSDMVKKVEEAEKIVEQAKKSAPPDAVMDEDNPLGDFRSKSKRNMEGHFEDPNEAEIASELITALKMDSPMITKIDDYGPKCFGLEMPKRLFWEGYVMRAKDISRPPGSEFDSGRPSQPGFQDMNFASIKDKFDPDSPRAVVWQYTDPYQPRDQPDPDPMLPQTLLVAYEENGRVLPVVSDFDCFLLGTRGIRFHNPLPKEQAEMVLEMVDDIEKILHDCTQGKSKAWTASWFENMKSKTTHHTMPKYGFGDPKSYAIMKHAVKRLEEFGAVRHGAECFNYYFPQDLDDEYLVIGGNLEGAKYKYMKLDELQNFLSNCIDKGFTFPLNPKWVLCDKGWKAIWDKLLASPHPNVESSINVWCPPCSGIRERIEAVHKRYPQGYEATSEKKKGTTLWDEAEMALEKYQRIQRAKRKLLVVLLWISILQKCQKKVLEKKAKMDSDEAEHGCEVQPKLKVTIGETTTFVHDKPMRDNGVKSNSFNVEDSDTADETDDLNAIQSLLDSSSSNLTNSQSTALRRTLEMFDNHLPQTSHRRALRRHTSNCLSINPRELEEVPSFILKEYGGAEIVDKPVRSSKAAKLSFKSAVEKVIAARRFIDLARSDSMECNLKVDHLPAEWKTLSRESKEIVAKKLSFKSLSSWEFDVLEFAEECNGAPLLFIGWAILGSPHAQRSMANDLGLEVDNDGHDLGYDFVNQFQMKLPVLCNFLRTTESNYLPNPYHNSTHAADVLVTTNSLFELGGNNFAETTLHVFSLLVAAIIHDVKHPGLNNNFQTNSQSEVAVQYNDVSVLENTSVSWFFSKLIGPQRDHSMDIFSGLTPDQFVIARSVVVRTVLDTDMSHHFLMMAKMQTHQEEFASQDSSAWFSPYTVKGCTFNPALDMLGFILHIADISNPAKPHPMFLRWADSILTECFAQGDKEASMGLPISPLCDRATTGKKQSQVGFIKFVVQPAFECLANIIPEVNDLIMPCIEKSLNFWADYNEDELNGSSGC